MSQTLTKPILLDETGQAIAGKLDTNSAAIVEALEDIKDAVSMGTDFVPVMIKVTTPPAKVSYMAGENLNLAGIVVSLIASNGVQVDITEQCTFLPANGTPLTASDTSVAISYYWYKDDVTFTTSYPIGVKSLSSIAITTPPTITEYMVGDELDLTGIVVTATYDDGTFLDVTQNCTFNPADGTVLTASNTSVTVTYTEGTITKTASQSITVIPVYGVEWDGSSSSAFTRTDAAANFTDPVPQMSNGSGGWTEGSSPFDAILPWAGMEVVTDGTLGKLVKIPKFYYSLDCSNGVKLKISSMRFEGSFVSPAHMDRGDGVGERDYVYVGAYHCSTLYKSTTGATIKNQTGLSNFNSSIHNLSVDAWLWDYATLTTIRMLYLVEFADWNSQAKIGYGCAPVMGTIGYTGATDSMTYHTGTTATALTNYGHVKYRHIEDLWAGVQDYVNGIHTIGNDVYARILPTTHPQWDATYEEDIDTGIDHKATLGAYEIKSWTQSNVNGLEWFMYPAETIQNNNYDTYCCDNVSTSASTSGGSGTGKKYTVGAATGGDYNSQGQRGGLFMIITGNSNFADTTYGARLMKLPNS